ncbi:DELLA protein RGL1-like protein [Cinnamomum micranthum f. kanehirae]|uniref:DELLA protein RGL1-like protein n=1 Tax=Cinnamomum micranthum f. kanehirae TaxID=337451 RepID=A0A3S3NFR1_9MAGN|nr:DELLA protein RGL1-like protein [Cinnamomum micranthum f. kanehirae]
MANPLFSLEAFHSNGGQEIDLPGFGRAGKATNSKDGMHSDLVCMEIQPSQEATEFNAGPNYHLESSWVDSTMELVELKGITKEHVEHKKEKARPISCATLELLRSYITGCKRLNGEKLIDLSNEAACPKGGRRLSTKDVMRVASAHIMELSVQIESGLSTLGHPSVSILPSLTDEEIKDVELAHLLLATADKISNQQYDEAYKLLTQCCYLSSNVGNPVQRVVYYFAGALLEKIDRETGTISSRGVEEIAKWRENIHEALIGPHPAHLAWLERLPFPQIIQFTEIQAILDNVGSAKKIHVIDLGPGIGIQWAALIQALAVRVAYPFEHLKISVVGTSAENIMKIRKWLVSFAKTLNLPFSFKAVVVSDMKDIKEDLFELDANEVVGVYAHFTLRTMLARPDCLENLMKVIKKLNPSIMIVTEVEVKHNSPSFINRFTKVLFHYCALFDCLDTYMDSNDTNRMLVEDNFFSLDIRCMIATEGSESIIMNVENDDWRSFFKRFGFEETELSQRSLDQANLVVKQVAHGSYCTLGLNGKALTVGWRGAPLFYVSAWKLN